MLYELPQTVLNPRHGSELTASQSFLAPKYKWLGVVEANEDYLVSCSYFLSIETLPLREAGTPNTQLWELRKQQDLPVGRRSGDVALVTCFPCWGGPAVFKSPTLNSNPKKLIGLQH